MALQMWMNVLKEFITVPVEIKENVTTSKEGLNVFVMMVMRRMAVECALVSLSIQSIYYFIVTFIHPQILMNVSKKKTCASKTVPTQLVAMCVAVVRDMKKTASTA